MTPLKPKAIPILVSVLILGCLILPSSIDRYQSIPGGKLRPALGRQYTLLAVGDSLSISLGEQLEDYFSKHTDRINFQRLGKVSSGLARPDFFNWELNLEDLVRRWSPDIVILMLGTNDNKPLNRDNQTMAFGTDSWRREYTTRLQHLLEICRQRNPYVRVFWMGAPIMAEPLLRQQVRFINHTIEFWCQGEPACEYISTWSTLADKEGKYAQYLVDSQTGEPILIRANDGVHLASHGSRLLAGEAVNAIQKYYDLE